MEFFSAYCPAGGRACNGNWFFAKNKVAGAASPKEVMVKKSIILPEPSEIYPCIPFGNSAEDGMDDLVFYELWFRGIG